MDDTLITHATVVTVDSSNNVLRDAAIAIRGREIVAVGSVRTTRESVNQPRRLFRLVGNTDQDQTCARIFGKVEIAARDRDRTQCRNAFQRELRWSVKNAMWVLGVPNPNEVIREIKRYSLRDIVGLIHQPTLILHGEKDHFIPQEQVDMLCAGLKAPKTLRVFTEEEGAEEHCQLGNMTLMHQVLFDWLDKIL